MRVTLRSLVAITGPGAPPWSAGAFFVLMGIQVHLPSLVAPGTLALGGALLVCAVVGKLVTRWACSTPA